ncbi:MAG: hypothetical protein OEY49_07145 [Candidatus Heimdallarchaeota archaeon]|nr:hypothetical protein [Candidatus Heimdallarchaeota archaeon]
MKTSLEEKIMWLELSLLFFNLLIRILFSYHFYQKWVALKMQLTLYWLLTFMGFTLASLIVIIQYIIHYNLEEAIDSTLMVSLISLGFLSLSVGKLSFIPVKKRIYSGIIGLLLLSSILMNLLTGSEDLIRLSLLLFTLIIFGGYVFLSLKARDFALLLVSLGLIIIGLSGILSSKGVLNIIGAIMVRALGQIVIALGLIKGKISNQD